MINCLWRQVLLATSLALAGFAQGLENTATKEDWEEINFERGSAILTDGYPSLLRLAELLKRHPGYRVKLEGHGDDGGTDRYNEKLGMQRATTVRNFLTKYGVPASQIETTTRGRKDPKVSGRSKEAQFMNRRVNVTVKDEQGRSIGDGSISDAIEELQKRLSEMQKRSDDSAKVLSKLDRLDEILAMLRDMKKENAELRRELDALKAAQQQTDKNILNLPKPLSASEVRSITERASADAIDKSRAPRFSLLGVNAGVDDSGKLTFSGRARYFAPFKENFAFQSQGEYLYFRDRKEGQFDLGLVYRYKNFQPGLFSSFKNVQVNELRSGGTLGQAALTLDYIFGRGKVGMFGTKAFLDNQVLAVTPITRTLQIQHVLKAIDQVGAQATVGLYRNVYAEGNLGYLKSYGHADRPGGTLRFVFPLNNNLAFTVEGGFNETLLARSNNGRVVAGLLFGNLLRPKEFQSLSHPVPADVPRVRYEILQRRVRTGNEAPVADAGPDQLGVQPGPVTLDGSGSFDPEGDPITFQWTQIAGPAVSIAGATTARATFTAVEGQSYGFRLTVTDDKGASSVARVNVTVSRTPPVRILRFVASPQQIRSGETSTLSWAVENAEEVVIDGIGRVNPASGSSTVAPTQTTTYRLTARNRNGEVSETVTVAVQRPEVRILFFQASPMTILAGQSSVLSWQTEGAESVEISGIGAVAQNGTQSVSPTTTTTYVLTARNRFGQATAQVSVQVNPAPMARVVRFSAAPVEIVAGEQATLVWQVENAETVTITGLGQVAFSGTANVTPATTTTYTLVARNASGEVSAETTVTVFPATRIVSFVANPTTSPRPGAPVTLSWTTEGATEVFLDGVGPVSASGARVVNPQADTTYTLRAFGRRGQVTARVDVKVTPAGPVGEGGPVANAGPDQVTTNREVQLDGTRSFHPEGLVIGYSWRAVGRQPELILGADTATPTVRFAPLAFGEYVFELTVTDSRGRFSKATTKVFFGAY
ncbi:MAG: OmpA family protein [Bryobacteraceae bacterium]|nr:OmpA family protein [Bryobacteraceae bacterium]MDW8379965.1 OmpA family protein [Bryobacterales bacterium]